MRKHNTRTPHLGVVPGARRGTNTERKVLNMQKLLIALVASLALAGNAVAGVEGHITAQANGETHTIDVWLHDDGTYVLLVDGEPLAPPEAPGTPEIPALPEVPGIPELPALPEAPGIPETPELPGIPTLP